MGGAEGTGACARMVQRVQKEQRKMSGALSRMINRTLSAAFEAWQSNAAKGKAMDPVELYWPTIPLETSSKNLLWDPVGK